MKKFRLNYWDKCLGEVVKPKGAKGVGLDIERDMGGVVHSVWSESCLRGYPVDNYADDCFEFRGELGDRIYLSNGDGVKVPRVSVVSNSNDELVDLVCKTLKLPYDPLQVEEFESVE